MLLIDYIMYVTLQILAEHNFHIKFLITYIIFSVGCGNVQEKYATQGQLNCQVHYYFSKQKTKALFPEKYCPFHEVKIFCFAE